MVERSTGKALDMDQIDYNDTEVLDSLGTGTHRWCVPAGKCRYEKLHEGVKATEPGGYHRRYFPVPSGPDGFYPISISVVKTIPTTIAYDCPELESDPGTDVRMYRLSGAGHADRAGSGRLYTGTK